MLNMIQTLLSEYEQLGYSDAYAERTEKKKEVLLRLLHAIKNSKSLDEYWRVIKKTKRPLLSELLEDAKKTDTNDILMIWNDVAPYVHSSPTFNPPFPKGERKARTYYQQQGVAFNGKEMPFMIYEIENSLAQQYGDIRYQKQPPNEDPSNEHWNTFWQRIYDRDQGTVQCSQELYKNDTADGDTLYLESNQEFVQCTFSIKAMQGFVRNSDYVNPQKTTYKILLPVGTKAIPFHFLVHRSYWREYEMLIRKEDYLGYRTPIE